MNNTIKEDKMAPIVVDLNHGDNVDESWLRMFGENIKGILKAMFGNVSIPVQVRGTSSQVDSFVKALGGEKKYISTLKRYGLDSPRSYRSKAELARAVSNFERRTGIRWPFK